MPEDITADFDAVAYSSGLTQEGRCLGCADRGLVGAACSNPACVERRLHFVPDEYHAKLAHLPRVDPMLGTVVGDYLVVDTLGAGAFGVVYLALQLPILMKAALKLLTVHRSDAAAAAAFLANFRLEAEALARLTHPNIVRLLKYGNHGDSPYLVMEYVAGGRSLKDEVASIARRREMVDPEFVRQVLTQLLKGLEAAHGASIVHRDIKPDNIMLQEQPGDPHHVKVLDFGLAKFVAEGDETCAVAGTPAYMAPEQLSGSELGPWTDLYAVGVIAFEMITGRRPFVGRTGNEIFAEKTRPDYDPAAQLDGLQLPEIAPDFFRRALAREPSERFQSAAEFRAMLYRLLAGFDANATPYTVSGAALLAAIREERDDLERVRASMERERAELEARRGKTARVADDPRRRRRAPWLVLLAAALLLVGGAATAIVLASGGEPEPEPVQASAKPAPPSDPCEAGDFKACEKRAERLRSGKGVEKDLEAAAGLYAKACDGGRGWSCYRLGQMHARGRAVPKDAAAALALQEKACRANIARACTIVGDAYRDGEGVAADVERAAALYRKACDGGSNFGCGALGVMHQIGRGVPRDFGQAFELVHRGCQANHHPACVGLGRAYELGWGVPRSDKAALEAYTKACSRKSSLACADVGAMHRDGKGTRKDVSRALRAFERGCTTDDGRSCGALGELYAKGRAVRRDVARAKRYYDKGCNLGHDDSCRRLADLRAPPSPPPRPPVVRLPPSSPPPVAVQPPTPERPDPKTAATCAKVKLCCTQLAKEIPHLAPACSQLGAVIDPGGREAKMICEQVLQGFAMMGGMLRERMPSACR